MNIVNGNNINIFSIYSAIGNTLYTLLSNCTNINHCFANISLTTIPQVKTPEDHVIEKFEWDLNDFNIIISACDYNDAELNLLILYHEVKNNSAALDEFFKTYSNLSLENYPANHWSEIKPWELRENISLTYGDMLFWQVQVLPSIPNIQIIFVQDIVIDCKKIFFDLCSKLKVLILHQTLEKNIKNLDKFFKEILTEFELLEKIVYNTVNKKKFEWNNTRLSLVSEAIIQRRLREQGYEIKCFNLNSFPTDTTCLMNILEKI